MGYPPLRIEMAREALKLFMQSLPAGSLFKIISFGSRFEALSVGGKTVIEYTDENRQEVLTKIESFSSDFGGTNI